MTGIDLSGPPLRSIVQYVPYLLEREAGTTNAGRGWCEALARTGIEVSALVDPDARVLDAPRAIECVSVKHRGRGVLRVPIGIGRRLEGADLLVVHGGWVLGNIVAARAARRAGIPYVVTSHGVYNSWVLDRRTRVKNAWHLVFERMHLQHALAVHVFFEEERRGLQRLGTVPRLLVAPNGVADRSESAWDGGSGGYLLWLGRFDVHVKGLDLLLHAVALMRPEERVPIRFHGLGLRDNKTRLAALAERLGVAEWISIGEPVYGADKWRLLSKARGYVQPSRWDTCPVALAEAVGAGVPALVTDYPLGKLLAGEGGAILADRTAEGIADGLRRLLSPEAAQVGSRGRRLASDRLSWDVVVATWLAQANALRNGRAQQAAR